MFLLVSIMQFQSSAHVTLATVHLCEFELGAYCQANQTLQFNLDDMLLNSVYWMLNFKCQKHFYFRTGAIHYLFASFFCFCIAFDWIFCYPNHLRNLIKQASTFELSSFRASIGGSVSRLMPERQHTGNKRYNAGNSSEKALRSGLKKNLCIAYTIDLRKMFASTYCGAVMTFEPVSICYCEVVKHCSISTVSYDFTLPYLVHHVLLLSKIGTSFR